MEFIGDEPEPESLAVVSKAVEVPMEFHSADRKTDSDETESVGERLEREDEIAAAKL